MQVTIIIGTDHDDSVTRNNGIYRKNRANGRLILCSNAIGSDKYPAIAVVALISSYMYAELMFSNVSSVVWLRGSRLP